MPIVHNDKIIVDEIRNRVIVRDPDNVFLGTVDNLWSNPLNWSLGFLPTAGHNVIIETECLLTGNYSVKNLINNSSLTTSSQSVLTVNNLNNNGYILVDGSFRIYGGFIKTSIIEVNGRIEYYNSAVFDFPEINYSGSATVNIGNFSTAVFDSSYSRPINIILGASYSPVLWGRLTLLDDVVVTINNIGNNINTSGNNINIGERSGLIVNNYDANGSTTMADTAYIKILGDLFRVSRVSTITNLIFQNSGDLRMFYNLTSYINNLEIGGTVNYIMQGGGGLLVVDNINGQTSVSEFNLKTFISYTGEVLMSTGSFNTDFADSNLIYSRSGNQDIRVPDDGGYRQLTLQGSGVKKLTGNTTCEHLYFAGSATLDENGYSLTGYNKYTDLRNGSYNIPTNTLDELTLGAGTKTLLNNKSVINFYQNQAFTLVKGSYSLSATNFYNRTNSTSSLSPSDVSATNWFYDNNGNQSVIGGAYTNLTLGGSGVKTLAGNITYTGTYTVTGTATVNLNGFTITKI